MARVAIATAVILPHLPPAQLPARPLQTAVVLPTPAAAATEVSGLFHLKHLTIAVAKCINSLILAKGYMCVS